MPASFVITPQDGLIVTTVGDTKILTWTRNLVEGETYNIYYEFDAPDVSPYLFTLGALEIGSFKEVRQWMIASDAEVTYYFNDYVSSEKWWKLPDDMVDGATGTNAYTNVPGDVELLTENTCLGTDLGPIDTVKIRAHGYYIQAGDVVTLRPVFTLGDGSNYDAAIPQTTGAWGSDIDITIDPPNAPLSWTWSDVQNLDCDVESTDSLVGHVYVGKVEIIVTYTSPASWGSYKTGYPDDSGTQCDQFVIYPEEHQVYMYGVDFASGESYKVVYWDADGTKRMVDTGVTVAVDRKLRSTWTFAPGQATQGNWHVTVYYPSDYPTGDTYSASDSHIVVDDTSYSSDYSFYVSDSAIPEFPTVIAAIAVCMLCAVAYVVMRRKAEKG